MSLGRSRASESSARRREAVHIRQESARPRDVVRTQQCHPPFLIFFFPGRPGFFCRQILHPVCLHRPPVFAAHAAARKLAAALATGRRRQRATDTAINGFFFPRPMPKSFFRGVVLSDTLRWIGNGPEGPLFWSRV